MTRVFLTVLGILVIIAGIVAASSLFTVHQTEQSLVLQFGEPRRVVKEPGLHVKLPFIQNVVHFDARVLDYSPPSEEIITSDQKRLVVDTYARFKIIDPLKFYQSTGSEAAFRQTLSNYMTSSLRRVIGNQPFSSVLSKERAQIMSDIQEMVNADTARFGVDVIDFRIRRADLPEANAQAIYSRMQSEREREAREFRAQGAELAQRIRSRAERERTVLVAEAQKQGQILSGEGDAEATKIYADSFGQDQYFFSFYRSMQAYRESMGEEGTTVVLSPDSEFFRYFGDINGGMGAGVGGTSAPRPQGGTGASPSTPSPSPSPSQTQTPPATSPSSQ